MIRRHERFYFSDGNLRLQVENTEYLVHRYLFETHARNFIPTLSERRGADYISAAPRSISSAPYILKGIKRTDFDRLLSCLYPHELMIEEARSSEGWVSILELASKWEFQSLCRRAINELGSLATPIERVILGRKYNIPELRLPAYVDLCQSTAPLTEEDGERLGLQDVIKIYRVRQEWGGQELEDLLAKVRIHFSPVTLPPPPSYGDPNSLPPQISSIRLPSPSNKLSEESNAPNPLVEVLPTTPPQMPQPARPIFALTQTLDCSAVPLPMATGLPASGVSASKKATLRDVNGTEVNIESLKTNPAPPTLITTQNLPVTPTRKTGTIRIETPEQRQKRLEAEEQKEKFKAEAEEKARKEGKMNRDDEARKKKEVSVQRPDWEAEPLPIITMATTLTRKPSLLLTLARPLKDLSSVTYPLWISPPNAELSAGAREGKFRYDREFLLQFRSICKENLDLLPLFDVIALKPIDQPSLIRDSSGRSQQLSSPSASSRPVPIGSGLPGATLRSQYQSMGQFTTPGKFGPGLERFEPAGACSVSMGGPSVPFGSPPLQLIANQGGLNESRRKHRTRSQRGEKRSNVVTLQATEYRWERKFFASHDPESPEVVDRKVKALLNKLTMEKFDSISDQIIQWANRSEHQKDGRTLVQVIRLVFEKAADETTWSEMYARLCRKMMEQISPKVQDEGIKSAKGKPIAGGQLFRKYLLNRCQEDFERGWVAKEATAAAAASKAKEDSAIKDANEQNSTDEVALYSEEYHAMQKAKRQGPGLSKFIGELFKLRMLTERIMHECIKKLLGNVHDSEEEDIESLCKLMTTVGLLLDTQKGRAHMDVYFQRMKELTLNINVTPRMQFMLQDVLELRERKWVPRNASAGPATLAQIHEAAAKEKAAQEEKLTLSRGGSQRAGDLSQFGRIRPASRAYGSDLSQFGRISKTQPVTTFAGNTKLKRESIPGMNSSFNMLSMFSMFSVSGAAKENKEPQKRTFEEGSPALSGLSEEAADAEVTEDVKEFFNARNLDEAEAYFSTFPPRYHHSLVNKLVASAVESKEPDAQLVADLFRRAKNKGLCSPDAFEEGLTPIAEIIEGIVIDAPKAWSLFATMVNGAELDEEHRTRLASKSTDSDKLLGLLSS